jgi:transcription elongation factor GreB
MYFLALEPPFHLNYRFPISQENCEISNMGRWRPPTPQSSPYITPAGFATLQRELQDIWVRRRDVVKALAAAAAEGDRSENAEYIYRKKELGGLDWRIRYLQKRLPSLNVVRESPENDAIYFGATVELQDDTGNSYTYRIVGADEADAKTSSISMDSPLARALLAKRVDDDVVITTGEKTVTMSVVSVRYELHE